MVAEKTAKNFRGLLFCRTLYSKKSSYIKHITKTNKFTISQFTLGMKNADRKICTKTLKLSENAV